MHQTCVVFGKQDFEGATLVARSTLCSIRMNGNRAGKGRISCPCVRSCPSRKSWILSRCLSRSGRQ